MNARIRFGFLAFFFSIFGGIVSLSADLPATIQHRHMTPQMSVSTNAWLSVSNKTSILIKELGGKVQSVNGKVGKVEITPADIGAIGTSGGNLTGNILVSADCGFFTQDNFGIAEYSVDRIFFGSQEIPSVMYGERVYFDAKYDIEFSSPLRIYTEDSRPLTINRIEVATKDVVNAAIASVTNSTNQGNAQLAVVDEKPTTIEHGKFYSFKPNSTETAHVTLSTGFDDGMEDEARLFFDCGTAAPDVTIASGVKVVYKEGSLRLTDMKISETSVPNRYFVNLRWFKTSASGTDEKFVFVDVMKVTA